ncbi:MAG: hypothetical protein R2856_09360 [Caldilineaceae bacterium]
MSLSYWAGRRHRHHERGGGAAGRAQIDQSYAVWVSSSHPYAVKPTSTIVAEAIGTTPATRPPTGNSPV